MVVAEKIEKIIMPTKIQIIVKIRPAKLLGERSPYPTGIIETTTEQKPLNSPCGNECGNGSWLVPLSNTYIISPATTAIKEAVANKNHMLKIDSNIVRVISKEQ